MHFDTRSTGLFAWILCIGVLLVSPTVMAAQGSYADLLVLFEQWREFERPALRDGAPDYTAAAVSRRHEELKRFQARLAAINPESWPVGQRIDYDLVRAQLNGLEFDIRWLRPWERDPAFYQSVWTEQSDTPEHEGPVNHALVELWQYQFPLSADDEAKLAGQLRSIPPLLEQARLNLTGNARDLWLTGTGSMQQQAESLSALAMKTSGNGSGLRDAIAAASKATGDFVAWLQAQAPSKTGPSGVGKEAYDWSLRNVHLVPLTWTRR